ncbi:MAG: deoxynucleoside kinase [Pseudomonadota bacterium]
MMSTEDKKTSGDSRFVVVEGPIGVGKTSLARRLAESLGGELLLEEVADNPFLERFYRNGKGAALPAQLYFLFQRAKRLDDLHQDDLFANVKVADFHIDKDRLFASVNLDPDELALYEQMYEKMQIEPREPDLVIYLQASVDALMQRISRRGVPHDRFIDHAYLERITDAYARYYHEYDQAPLLIVNASSIDPIGNDADYAQLLDRVVSTTSGRHFFNPAAAAALA